MSIQQILFIIYFTGVVPCYIFLKKYILFEKNIIWTKGDRIMGLCLMFTSWLGVLTSLFCIVVYKYSDNDNRASW